MPLDTSAAQAILAAARANPDVIWQMGMPLNRNGTLNTQAHLANQYIDYANRGYGAAPPDWNTFLQRANQGWTVTDAFNGRQAGDQFAYQNYYPTGPQGGTQQSGTIPSPPTPPSPPSVGPPGSSIGPAPVTTPPSPSSPPSVGTTPSTLPGQNPINPGLLGTASRQWTGAPWRAGQFSNFSGSFFPAFGIQGVQNYVYPQQPGGTVTRTPGAGLPSVTPGTTTGPGTTTRSPDQQQSLSSTSYTPRSFVDWTQGGIQMPYRNQYEQYTQSLAMAQPWNPSFRYTQGSFNMPLARGGPQMMGRGLLGGMTNFVGDTPRTGGNGK